MSRNLNIIRIKAVAQALAGLQQPIVFVGGATVTLYADPEISPEVRPTDDVDVLVELASYAAFHSLEAKLLTLGFVHDTSSPVICRYTIQGITVDIMPTTPEAIGFSNRWYPEGFANAITIDLADQPVNIFSLPYFLASKMEAYRSRGHNDLRYSTDFEDIVFVLENNSTWPDLLQETSGKIRAYLQATFKTFLADPDFEEGLYAHLERQNASQKHHEIINLLTHFITSELP